MTTSYDGAVKRVRTWLLVAPLVLASSQLAHALLNHLVDDEDRAAELVGAGGLSLTGVLAIAGALAIAGVAALALAGPSRRSPQLSAWPFALLPVATFALQEHVELTLARGYSATPVLEPGFLLGLALQLPLAAGA